MPHEVSPESARRSYSDVAAPLKPTIGGRIGIGILLALGMYLGLRKVATGTVLALIADPEAWWLSFDGLATIYSAQAAAVAFGSVMAAAGRLRGSVHGLAVGLGCGLLFLGFELLAGAPHRDLVIYLQPPVLAILGLVSGVVGARIWAGAPVLDIPLPNTSKLSSIQLATDSVTNPGRPTVWIRVLLGAMVMICCASVADRARHFVQKNSAGLLRVQNLGQGEFITWQLATLAILIGGGIAGSGTGAGVRHGFYAGAIGGIGILGVCIKQGSPITPMSYWLARISLDELPMTDPSVCLAIGASVLAVGWAGGWLGGALFCLWPLSVCEGVAPSEAIDSQMVK